MRRYRPGLWYYECIDLVRRNMMMGALTFIGRIELRVVIGLGFAITAAVAYRELAPFSSGTITVLATAAMNQARDTSWRFGPIVRFFERHRSCML